MSGGDGLWTTLYVNGNILSRIHWAMNRKLLLLSVIGTYGYVMLLWTTHNHTTFKAYRLTGTSDGGTGGEKGKCV